jgi:hypothetical protein
MTQFTRLLLGSLLRPSLAHRLLILLNLPSPAQSRRKAPLHPSAMPLRVAKTRNLLQSRLLTISPILYLRVPSTDQLLHSITQQVGLHQPARAPHIHDRQLQAAPVKQS